MKCCWLKKKTQKKEKRKKCLPRQTQSNNLIITIDFSMENRRL